MYARTKSLVDKALQERLVLRVEAGFGRQDLHIRRLILVEIKVDHVDVSFRAARYQPQDHGR